MIEDFHSLLFSPFLQMKSVSSWSRFRLFITDQLMDFILKRGVIHVEKARPRDNPLVN